jgi:hypothetical protein
MWTAWNTIVNAADPFLDTLTTEYFLEPRTFQLGDNSFTTNAGNLIQRVIYHYWYHNGENQAIRQQMRHRELQDFVGNIDDEAPYMPH